MTANEIWEKHKQVIPGGVVSLNRTIDPMRVFVRAKGAYLWDSDGKQYIDYHAAFSPYLLGHSDTDVDEAVIRAIREERSLMGAGTTPWEGELAELLVEPVIVHEVEPLLSAVLSPTVLDAPAPRHLLAINRDHIDAGKEHSMGH